MTALLTTLLALVPLAVVFATLLGGRYPGESMIEALRVYRPRRRAPLRAGLRFVTEPRCGSHAIGLLSCGLAGRAPPATGCT